VLGVEIERPANFNYEAGDYVFVKSPELSSFEWHPFTISSAPEDKQTLTVHIRAAGSWTGALYELFNKQRKALQDASNTAATIRVPLYLDGPYGTSSAQIFKSKYAILIGSGIGVTPFASILKSILLREQSGDKTMTLQKVHFFWINRGQKSFEWFLALLADIEAHDRADLFDLHIYLTGVQEKSDMKSSTLFMAMDLLHAQTKVDLITGLKTKTELGRPDWKAHFRAIAQQHPGEPVDVYFCGAPALANVVSQTCDQFHFHFHKENF
jgi:predicted ferric reductase